MQETDEAAELEKCMEAIFNFTGDIAPRLWEHQETGEIFELINGEFWETDIIPRPSNE